MPHSNLDIRNNHEQQGPGKKDARFLPSELWALIIRHAVTVWPTSSFNVLEDDFSNVKGFSRACKLFREIAQTVRHENQVLPDYDYFVFLDKPCSLVKNMRINEILPERRVLTKTFYDSLSDYTNLKSLSLCSPEPSFTSSCLSSLSFADNLRRLDLRTIKRHDRRFWREVTLSLPNLVDLRLGDTEFLSHERMANIFRIREERSSVYLDLVEFISDLASRLEVCSNLRHLTLHLMLMSASAVSNGQIAWTPFNDVETRENEEAATFILARCLTRLEEVHWVNPWVDKNGAFWDFEVEESSRKPCKIMRYGSAEDGQEVVQVVRESHGSGPVPLSAGCAGQGSSPHPGQAWLI